MAKLISSESFLATRKPHESLHPGQGHFGITTVIRSIEEKAGKFKHFSTPMPEDRQSFYSELGAVWEAALEQEFKLREGERQQDVESALILQDKMCIEGLHLIPDGYIKKKVLHEYKLTFRKQPSSPDKLLDLNWSWGIQTKCYCHVLGINTVEFYVCYLERWPTPIKYTFKYTKKECKQAWDQIMEQANLLRMMNNTEV